jgi:WD40 repeat protein
MGIRRILSVFALLGASVAWWSPSRAAVPATVPQRSVALAIGGDSSGDDKPAVEAVVNFGPAIPISGLTFSADGKTLAVGGYQEVLVWDLGQARLAKRLGTGQLRGLIHALAFVDGGKALAAGDGDPTAAGAVRVFGLTTGEVQTTWSEPQCEVCSLAASPDGKLLAAGGADALVHVWDLASRKLLKTLNAHKARVLGLAFSGDSKRLATAGSDQTMQVWNVTTWEQVMRYDVAGPVHAVALSASGNTLLGAVGGADDWAIRWAQIDTDLQQVARRRPAARTTSTGATMPLDVCWPPQGSTVYVACHDNTIRTFLTSSNSLSRTFSGHTDWVYAVATTPDGSRLASGSADGTVKLWNVATGKPVATLIQLAPGADEWAIVTSEGYFTASSSKAVAWKTGDGSAVPPDLASRYEKAESVRDVLAATNTPPSGLKRKDKTHPRPPKPFK